MNDFCDLLGTPYAPVSKIAPVKFIISMGGPYFCQLIISRGKAPLYTKLTLMDCGTQIYLDLPPLVWDMIAFT